MYICGTDFARKYQIEHVASIPRMGYYRPARGAGPTFIRPAGKKAQN